MIYSRSAEYAIRAFVQLATVPEGKYAMVKQIAEQADIPAHFLAKILQQLARKGFLRLEQGADGRLRAPRSSRRAEPACHRRSGGRAVGLRALPRRHGGVQRRGAVRHA